MTAAVLKRVYSSRMSLFFCHVSALLLQCPLPRPVLALPYLHPIPVLPLSGPILVSPYLVQPYPCPALFLLYSYFFPSWPVLYCFLNPRFPALTALRLINSISHWLTSKQSGSPLRGGCRLAPLRGPLRAQAAKPFLSRPEKLLREILFRLPIGSFAFARPLFPLVLMAFISLTAFASASI